LQKDSAALGSLFQLPTTIQYNLGCTQIVNKIWEFIKGRSDKNVNIPPTNMYPTPSIVRVAKLKDNEAACANSIKGNEIPRRPMFFSSILIKSE
jgi:hypothetical protein